MPKRTMFEKLTPTGEYSCCTLEGRGGGRDMKNFVNRKNNTKPSLCGDLDRQYQERSIVKCSVPMEKMRKMETKLKGNIEKPVSPKT